MRVLLSTIALAMELRAAGATATFCVPPDSKEGSKSSASR